MRDMVAISYKINKIIEKPQRKMTVDEAKDALKKCGVMNKNGEIKAIYRKILIKKGVSTNEE